MASCQPRHDDDVPAKCAAESRIGLTAKILRILEFANPFLDLNLGTSVSYEGKESNVKLSLNQNHLAQAGN